MPGLRTFLVVGAFAVSSVAGTPKADTIGFLQTNLVSDGSVPAVITDPGFLNPWGLTESPSSPFWVSVNVSGPSNLYSVPGPSNTLVGQVPLVVTIPAASGLSLERSAPTGVVFNGTLSNPTPGFKLSNGSPATFLFDSEDGAIAGWNGGTTAELPVNNSLNRAVYKGLAIDSFDGTLSAANFNSGEVEMYNSSFGLVKSFTDPNIPRGYAPFNLSVITDKLYVTFAKQGPGKHDDESGAGNGFVNVFDLNGDISTRLISRGELNSPWDLQIAPPAFGTLAGDLLVGNFGDGRINAYDPTTGAFEGALLGPDDKPLSDLWALTLGNGSAGGGDPNTLYFTAGLKRNTRIVRKFESGSDHGRCARTRDRGDDDARLCGPRPRGLLPDPARAPCADDGLTCDFAPSRKPLALRRQAIVESGHFRARSRARLVDFELKHGRALRQQTPSAFFDFVGRTTTMI
jgi:uncharacterized protein (TIGR03118 family)